MGWWWRKRNKKLILERGAKLLEDLIEFGHGQSNPIKFLSADEILKATNNFSDSNRVSSDWYSGKNENHPMILIKKDVGLYSLRSIVSEKTDVCCAFGMFMGQTLLLGNKSILINGSRLMEDRRIEEIADPKMIEKMGQISEQELCQMEAFRMLSLRCIGPSEEVPTMVEVAKELKKIQTSLQNDSSSPSVYIVSWETGVR
ncbi:predicted protein [Arabidopsis lyrata subsp. lyrata]|uniref:Predicted protein n=1 Tax=Arabidopsis lyrata subsp. lyrata TaxID=81972 RepID=D7MQD2_ARALL|nr:predicted protein [Arabidopsis lyrata subsp. lyrata]